MERALPSRKTRLVRDESLDNWEPVDSGGFGDIYKASHKCWGFDVAIKIPRTDVCYKEATLMEKVSFEFVLRVYGIYQGCSPTSGRSLRCGIVMEFMRRGSVESLMNDLSGPPPWPLAFRLVHQVAAGMNFLHAERLVHQDLKPSNVLLTDDLNARLADFGLSRVSTSAVTSSSEQTGETGGTYKYMPPEAFDASYKPGRAFDIYSYGILLWSIVTGEEPYPAADYRLVALRIPLGDRPPCENIEKMEVEGLKELVDLMKRCWDDDPNKRPEINKCLKETEELFSKHKRAIRDAVDEVMKRLDSPNGNQRSETSVSNRRPPPQAAERSVSIDEVDMPSPVTRTPPTQGMRREFFHQDASVSSAKRMTDEEKQKLIEQLELIGGEVDNVISGLRRDNWEYWVVLFYIGAFLPLVKKAKAAFYILKRNYQHLVEDLGGF